MRTNGSCFDLHSPYRTEEGAFVFVIHVEELDADLERLKTKQRKSLHGKLEGFAPDQNLGRFSRFFFHTWSIRVRFELAVAPLLHALPGR